MATQLMFKNAIPTKDKEKKGTSSVFTSIVLLFIYLFLL